MAYAKVCEPCQVGDHAHCEVSWDLLTDETLQTDNELCYGGICICDDETCLRNNERLDGAAHLDSIKRS